MAEAFFGKTDTGKQRSNNEDTFIVQSLSGDALVAGCVIDGVGGYDGGEVAADIARNTFQEYLKQLSGNVTSIMRQAFVMANKKIFEEKNANAKNAQMACVATLAIADISQNKFYYAHVGDTRLYLLRDDSLVKVTHDHSVVGFLEDSGRLTEEAAMQHPKRNEITKALGFETAAAEKDDFVETGESPFLPGDIILLCSDGLSDMIDNAAITQILRFKASLKIKAKMLIDAANKAGGKDNITVVLIQNNKSRQQHEVTRPLTTNAVTTPKHVTEAKEPVPLPAEKPYRKAKSNKGLIIFLTILCIAFFCAFMWVLLIDSALKQEKPKPLDVVTVHTMSPEEISFRARLDTGTGMISIPGGVINLTTTINITKDTFRLSGNGLVLRPDSTNQQPAITISPETKYVLIDSVTFENFDVGIFLKNPVLNLKNVVFKNCRVHVNYDVLFHSDKPVTISLTDSLNHPFDSLRKPAHK